MCIWTWLSILIIEFPVLALLVEQAANLTIHSRSLYNGCPLFSNRRGMGKAIGTKLKCPFQVRYWLLTQLGIQEAGENRGGLLHSWVSFSICLRAARVSW